MPVTRSELLFLCGGAIAGAIAAKNYDKIKAKAGPLLAAAGGAVGDAYTAAARGSASGSRRCRTRWPRPTRGPARGSRPRRCGAPHFSTANGTVG